MALRSIPTHPTHLHATPETNQRRLGDRSNRRPCCALRRADCDGSSFTGTRPGSFNGLRYRGRANLDAVLDHLIEHEGLGAASDVIVTGGSAGGLAVYLNADHIASRLPKVPRTKALADGGFFRDVETTLGVQYARERYSAGLVLWQSSSSLSPTCLAANPGALSWRCIMAQYALPHITVPVFVVEGARDL